MQTRRLGRTGHQSSLAVLGGIVFHFVDEAEAGRVLHAALDAGVTHLDIAPGYLTAEATVGPHLPAVRDRLFIGEKSGETTRDAVRRQLDDTLRLLQTEAVDLYQLHGVTSVADLERRSGAVDALMEARDEGLCRWIGITGHDLGTAAAQHEALRRYDLDTVMLPINPAMWANDDYRRDAESLLAEAQVRDVGVHAIKAAAARPWADGEARGASTWYAPHTERAALEQGIRFALSTPGVTAFCTPGDASLLPVSLDIAAGYASLSDHERQAAIDAQVGVPSIFPLPA